MKYLGKVSGSNNWYYIRRIPNDVLQHYPNKKDKRLVISTRTPDKKAATAAAMRINSQHELEWERMRGNVAEVNQHSLQAASELLKSFGLEASSKQFNKELELDSFYDSLEDSLSESAKARIFEARLIDKYEANQIFKSQLGDSQKIAFDIVQGKFKWTASLICDEYLRLKNWNESKKHINVYKPAFKELIEFLGDRAPNEYSRKDVHELMNYMLELGHRTATVRKRLGCIRAAFNKIVEIHELKEESAHPFNKFSIPDLRLDAKEKSDFTPEELNLLRKKVAQSTDEISGLIAVMMETGLRVSEACSLKAEDLRELNGEFPFLTLHRNPLRRLKTKSSQRLIPLIGSALAFSKGVSGEWIFPRYVDTATGKVKNDTASSAVNKRLRSWLGDGSPTAHSFRHTMNTRLRDALCPKDIRDETLGWSKTVSDTYGSPTDIRIKTEYFVQSMDWKGQSWRE
jgi:integrase